MDDAGCRTAIADGVHKEIPRGRVGVFDAIPAGRAGSSAAAAPRDTPSPRRSDHSRCVPLFGIEMKQRLIGPEPTGLTATTGTLTSTRPARASEVRSSVSQTSTRSASLKGADGIVGYPCSLLRVGQVAVHPHSLANRLINGARELVKQGEQRAGNPRQALSAGRRNRFGIGSTKLSGSRD